MQTRIETTSPSMPRLDLEPYRDFIRSHGIEMRLEPCLLDVGHGHRIHLDGRQGYQLIDAPLPSCPEIPNSMLPARALKHVQFTLLSSMDHAYNEDLPFEVRAVARTLMLSIAMAVHAALEDLRFMNVFLDDLGDAPHFVWLGTNPRQRVSLPTYH